MCREWDRMCRGRKGLDHMQGMGSHVQGKERIGSHVQGKERIGSHVQGMGSHVQGKEKMSCKGMNRVYKLRDL